MERKTAAFFPTHKCGGFRRRVLVITMTDQEKTNENLQHQLALQDAKFNAFVDEMRDFKAEMRERDNQRAEDIREIRNNLQTNNMQASNRNLNIVTLLGIVAIVIALLLK